MKPFRALAVVLPTMLAAPVAFAFTQTEEKAIVEAAAIGDWRKDMDEIGLRMAVKVEPIRLRAGGEDATVTLTSEEGGTGVFGIGGHELIVMLRGKDGQWIKAISAPVQRVRPLRVSQAMPEIELIGGWPLANPPAMRDCNPVWTWRGGAYEFGRWLCPGKRLVAEPVITPVQTGQPRTIVGIWRLMGRQCTPFDGAIQIKPLGIVEHEGGCEFKSVSRVGDVVRWVGVCSGNEDDSDDGRADQRRTIVVTARAYGDRLTLQYGDNPQSPPYVRCNRARLFD